MKVIGRLYVILGVFALVAGAIYGLWGHEPAGTLYLVVLGVAFAYLARESGEYGDEPADVDEGASPIGLEHGAPIVAPEASHVSFHASAPSLTPLLFAVSIGLIVAGLVFASWLVFLGGGSIALVAIAWFIETGRRRAEEAAAKAGHGGGHH